MNSVRITSGLLAIDTSTEQAGISLSLPDRVVSHTWHAGRAQTTTVLPEIDRLIREAGETPAFVSGLIVATGPGTFTGLRVGMAIAKGIVAASGVPIVGVPTLDIVLAAHEGPHLIALLPAGRGRIVWQSRGESPRNTTVQELIAFVEAHPGWILCGEVQESQKEEIESRCVETRWEPRDPEVLLRIGAERMAAGLTDDPISLEPTYLHGAVVSAGPVTDKRPQQS